MKKRPNSYKPKGSDKIRTSIYTILFVEVLLLFGISIYILPSDSNQKPLPESPHAIDIEKTRPVKITIPDPESVKKQKTEGNHDNLWNGPILYHAENSSPIHLILVEKAIQKLHVYRYNGQYHHLKSYPCATGKQQGRKEVENDQKTPEGIF